MVLLCCLERGRADHFFGRNALSVPVTHTLKPPRNIMYNSMHRQKKTPKTERGLNGEFFLFQILFLLFFSSLLVIYSSFLSIQANFCPHYPNKGPGIVLFIFDLNDYALKLARYLSLSYLHLSLIFSHP